MKAARQRNKRAYKVSGECSANICGIEAGKVRRTDRSGRKIAGKGDFLGKEDEHSSPFSVADKMRMRLSNGVTFLSSTTKDLPALELCPGRTYLPHTKIKLQLFPIDEITCKGLEKDGYHPYLELTLKARKKISSVLKHLNSKWGSSKVALGEPMLFPYNIHESMSGCRKWTLHDSDISAADVHASVGGPATFRLRYGWFLNLDPKISEDPPISAPDEDCLKSEATCRGYGTDTKKTNEGGSQTMVASEDILSVSDDEQRVESNYEQSSLPCVDGLTDISVGGLLSEASLQAKFNNSDPKSSGRKSGLQHTQVNFDSRLFPMWADNSSNISVGGLLSEASLQEKCSNSDAKAIWSNADSQSTQIISDSLDAFISAQNCSQGPRLSTYDSHSSILDAEETCHAFAFQKFSFSGKVKGLGGNSGGCSQDAGSKSFKFPKTAEVKSRAGVPQDHACQESETDLMLCSRAYNDESSLGLTGIKWSDSLGPFDLGLPASKKLASGDSISISGFVK
ncbi:hypothetical protein FNV43_RR18773 [Rhamnella rubrinervis]|uniref:TSL-kinase interacting protein 1 n=1 Tax=Rhamnella rubrinervis TaxID=2594499 RepID=A0A8K0E6J5_9ROSA|nr:hypothetical protein FNV43_RR18773 [Rhamnella rubrinervis]